MSGRYDADGNRCCYTYRGVLIPGCWGSAIYGRHRCTCRPVSDTSETLHERVSRLEAAVAALTARPTSPEPDRHAE